jgi:histidinol phosphatase-like enzyme
MIVYCDIDGVLMTQDPDNPINYFNAKPIIKQIKKLNKLYDEGHTIVLWTARGCKTGLDWRSFTEGQLKEFGVKYHELRLDKPYYDMFIDDRARSKL